MWSARVEIYAMTHNEKTNKTVDVACFSVHPGVEKLEDNPKAIKEFVSRLRKFADEIEKAGSEVGFENIFIDTNV